MALQHELDMSFNYDPVTFGEIKEGVGENLTDTGQKILENAKRTDKSFADVLQRIEGRNSRFNEMIVWNEDICPTIHNHGHYRGDDKCKFTLEDYRNAQTFPRDYAFESKAQAAYVCGMSVPPLMIKRIVQRLIDSGVFE